MSKHTPGPWKVIDGSAIWSQTFQTNTAIARANRRLDDTTHANARLIAAAPELLDALVMALESLDAAEVPQEWDCRKSVRAAIAKATGEKP